MENQHELIDGYRNFDQDTIDIINAIKGLEARVAEHWGHFVGSEDVDQRELALAKTHFQEAFMHFVKSVARPDDVW